MIRRLSYDEAAELLVAGEVVALPTDTVYGVAASIGHPAALVQLFALKSRPENVALPILAASLEQIEAAGIDVTGDVACLGDAFWPGALTIVTTAPLELARRLGASEPTAGVRVPNDPALLELLSRCGPLAVTSANVHGQAPCESADQVEAAFAGREDLAGVLDGGNRRASVSSVVDVTSRPWRVLREGAVSREALEEIEHRAR